MKGKRMVRYYDNNQLKDDLVGIARVLQKRACVKESLSFFILTALVDGHNSRFLFLKFLAAIVFCS